MAIRALVFFFMLVAGLSNSFAGNSGVTYQGRILKPDGSPLAGSNTQFKMQIRTPDAGNCLMYEELQALDLRNTNGAFSLTINDGNGTRTDSTGLGIDRIFANQGSFTFNPATCSSGGAYTPNNSDGRILVVYFKDETMGAWEPIPAQKINFVPFAFEAKQVAGFTADSLIRVVNASGDPLTGLAPLSNAQYTELMALVNGTSTAFTKSGQLGGVALPTMNSGEALGWNGSAWVSTPTGTPGSNSITTAMLQNSSVTSGKLDPAISISTTGTVATAITTTRDFKVYATSPSAFYVEMLAPALTASYTLTWPLTAGTSGQVLTTNGSGVLNWTTPSSAGITALTGDVTATGPSSAAATVAAVGTSTAANVHSAELLANAATAANTNNAIVKRDGSGNFAANVVTANGVTLNNAGSLLNIVNPIGAGYTLTLPTGTGVTGQVLTTNGTGVTSWTTPLTSATGFANGGSSFGGVASLGTTDNYNLNVMTNGATAMTIATNGKVGIGTTSPNAGLDVATGSTTALELRSGNLAPATTNSQIAFGYAGTTNYQHAIKTRHDSATVSGNAIDFFLWNQAVDPAGNVGTKNVMTLNANGNVGLNAAGGNFVNVGANVPQAPLQIAGTGNLLLLGGCCSWNTNFNVDGVGALTISGSNSGFGFYTNTQGGGNIVNLTNGGAFQIKAAGTPFFVGTTGGLVGIGTTSPVSKADINGPLMSAAAPFNHVLHDTTASAQDVGGGIAFGGYSDATTLSRFAGVRGGKENGTVSNNAGYLALHTRGNGGSITEKVRVTSDGKLGVGTVAPGVSLDVVGSARFTGGTTIGLDGELFYDTMAHAYKYYDSSSSSWKSLAAGNVSYTGTVWNQSGANASYTTGYVGVGTNTPAYLFDLYNGSGSTQLHIGATGTNSSNAIFENGSNVWTLGSNVGSVGGANFAIASNSGTALTVLSNGNVGIGTTAPREGLDVVGGGRFATVPGTLTTLSVTALAGDTSLTVASTAGYSPAGMIRLDNEFMTYSSVDATHFYGLTRGLYGTGASSHSSTRSVLSVLLSAGIQSSAIPQLIMYGDGTFQAGLGAGASPATTGGWGSVAIGPHAFAGGSSVALGTYANASGTGASSIGYQSAASGTFAFSGGYGTTASSYTEAALGETNLSIGTENGGAHAANAPVFVVGNGTVGVASSNSLVQFRNGQTIINSGTLTTSTTPSITTVINNAILTSVGKTTDSTAASINATDSAGASKFYVRNDGNVGIGTASPQATLDINGVVRLKQNASAPAACAAGNEGTLALTTKGTMCNCHSLNWVSVNDGTTACTW